MPLLSKKLNFINFKVKVFYFKGAGCQFQQKTLFV